MAKGMGSIRNGHAQGPFKTSGTEMWPAKMCQWIASLLLSAWASSATTASADVPDTQSKEGRRPLARRQQSLQIPFQYVSRGEETGSFWTESLRPPSWRGGDRLQRPSTGDHGR